MPTTAHIFKNLGNVRHILANGSYLITDPCYVFPDEIWSDLCDQVFCPDDNCRESGVIEMDGHKIWWGSTKSGDGCYPVRQYGAKVGEFCVDAGLFAIFPIEFVQKYKPDMVGDKRFGTTVTMGGAVSYRDGNMDCGQITAETDERNHDDDNEWDGGDEDPADEDDEDDK
jgi:hypothetical protein